MKKFLLFFVMLIALALTTKAQVLLSESFDEGMLPSGWNVIDNDGDGYTWDADFPFQNGFSANTGDGCISSASFRNDVGALTPDNWLITPQLNLTANSTLTFYLCGQDAGYCSEHYAVLLSTTGTQMTDFSVTLLEETFSPSRASTPYIQKNISLAAYTGQQVYIAFRHYDVTDMFWLNLDDVSVYVGSAPTAVENYEQVNVSVYPNPASNLVTIASAENMDQIQIVNMAGQCVYSANVAGNNVQVNVSDLADGMYFVKITANGAETVKKINVVK